MALLTSTPTCQSCAGLSQKVSDLEHRITLLFKIQEERDSDIILGKTRATATSAQLADTAHFSGGPASSTPRKTDSWATVTARNSRPESGSSHAGDIPLDNRYNVLNHEDFPPLPAPRSSVPHGLTQSGTPLLHRADCTGPPASTRRRSGNFHFTPAPGYRERRERGPDDSLPPLGVLHESVFPELGHRPPPSANAAALPGGSGSSSSRVPSPSTRGERGVPSAASSRTSDPSVRSQRGAPSAASSHTSGHSVRRVPGGQPAAPSPRASSQSARGELGGSSAAEVGRTRRRVHASAVTPVSGPSVLVLGSSMVRHVRVRKGYTHCLPGAIVLDIKNSAPRLIQQHPSASTVVIHVGTNDLQLQQSEKLKQDFISLITTIQNNNKTCIVSGPFSPPRFGDGKFSRVRLLHVFLKNYCRDNKIPYVDNFLTFFNRPELFKMDRLHLNFTGSRLLSLNIELTIESS